MNRTRQSASIARIQLHLCSAPHVLYLFASPRSGRAPPAPAVRGRCGGGAPPPGAFGGRGAGGRLALEDPWRESEGTSGRPSRPERTEGLPRSLSSPVTTRVSVNP